MLAECVLIVAQSATEEAPSFTEGDSWYLTGSHRFVRTQCLHFEHSFWGFRKRGWTCQVSKMAHVKFGASLQRKFLYEIRFFLNPLTPKWFRLKTILLVNWFEFKTILPYFCSELKSISWKNWSRLKTIYSVKFPNNSVTKHYNLNSTPQIP